MSYVKPETTWAYWVNLPAPVVEHIHKLEVHNKNLMEYIQALEKENRQLKEAKPRPPLEHDDFLFKRLREST